MSTPIENRLFRTHMRGPIGRIPPDTLLKGSELIAVGADPAELVTRGVVWEVDPATVAANAAVPRRLRRFKLIAEHVEGFSRGTKSVVRGDQFESLVDLDALVASGKLQELSPA